jgi:hypothetical protein
MRRTQTARDANTLDGGDAGAGGASAPGRGGHARPPDPIDHELLLELCAALGGERPAGVGRGRASGAGCVLRAARAALGALPESARLGDATNVLLRIIGDPSLEPHAVKEALDLVQDAAHEDAAILLSTAFGDRRLTGAVEVMLVTALADGPGPE